MTMPVNGPVPENLGKPPIRVRHADLKRWSDSMYKSVCPACPEGLLRVARNPETYELEEMDMCVVCGQVFIYEDIAELRTSEE